MEVTASRLACLRCCLEKHRLKYTLGLRKIREADALRFGSAYHLGIEQQSTADIREQYKAVPDWADPVKWATECETVCALVAGHIWRYSEDGVPITIREATFRLQIDDDIVAGKIDALGQYAGRDVIVEYKTTSDSVDTGSDYWARLACDQQISIYVLAAQSLGYKCNSVLYDVCRKPTIHLKKKETPEEYGVRLAADIRERPDYYFARREVVRLDGELYRAWVEIQDQIELIAVAEDGRWQIRNIGPWTCRMCEFKDLCLNAIRVFEGDNPPAGYEFVTNVNPELEESDATTTAETAE